MRLKPYVLAALTIWFVGCAAPVPQKTSLRIATDALLTQRAVLTVHGRQFTFNGYLSLSEREGMRLIMMHSLGQVVADVLIKPDGSVYIMRPSPVLRREWLERYVARDMACLFGNVPGPGQAVDATHFIVTERAYTLSLQTVETKPGPQSAKLFDETKAVVK